ncbi:hypothetical protein [Nannocystis pusilla]|uniref:hypothetical protein n=1 Tax=Nannocystis pusilla TaxID=889268 RepID=UPI003DA4CD90
MTSASTGPAAPTHGCGSLFSVVSSAGSSVSLAGSVALAVSSVSLAADVVLEPAVASVSSASASPVVEVSTLFGSTPPEVVGLVVLVGSAESVVLAGASLAVSSDVSV